MFSYRHAFHAGNHADVLKHTVLVQIIQYYRQKDTPFWYMDTHAGAGLYTLQGAWASKTAEFHTGIKKLWDRTDLPPTLAEYVQRIRSFNPDGKLRNYPGSPWLALQLMGERDRLRLFELHPSEAEILHDNVRRLGREQARRIMVYTSDGFNGLKALLPPPTRRGITLIDPSYEDKQDYGRVVKTVKEGLERFATGCYAVWYPIIRRREASVLVDKLMGLPIKSWLNASLTLDPSVAANVGLHGSGMFIINPPYTLQQQLQPALAWLAGTFGQSGRGEYLLKATDS